MNFIIASDSCVDELKTNLVKYGVRIIPMTITSDNDAFKDDFSTVEEYQDFYKQLSKGKIYKTSSLNATAVEDFFVELLKEEKDIIYISLSSGLSVTYDIVIAVAEKLNSKNKNKIYVVDSLSATQGQNLIMRLAMKANENNVPAHEAYAKLNWAVKHLDVTFFVSDFDCLRRGGRINGLQALVAKLALIRPILNFDIFGKLRIVQKVMGNKKAVASLVERLKNYNRTENAPVMIAHTGNEEMVDELERNIRENLETVEIIKNYIGPTIGSHTGANSLGLVFLGEEDRL